MGRRPLLVMVLGWLAVVGAVGAITFVVVSNAGSGVGRASAAERVIAVPPKPSQSSTVTSTATPTPSVTPSVPASPTASTKASTRASTTPEPDGPPDTPDPRPTSKAPRPPAPPVDRRTASFSTQGGIVVATCRGARISLVSIRPRDGWRVERSVTKVSIEAHFKAPEREIEIYLRCVDEVPTRLKPGGQWGGTDTSSPESRAPQLVHPPERVQSEGLAHATPTASSTPSSTQETPHG